jgi:AAA domain
MELLDTRTVTPHQQAESTSRILAIKASDVVVRSRTSPRKPVLDKHLSSLKYLIPHVSHQEGWRRGLAKLQPQIGSSEFERYFTRTHCAAAELSTGTIWIDFPQDTPVPKKYRDLALEALHDAELDVQSIHWCPYEDEAVESTNGDLRTRTLERVIQRKVKWLSPGTIPLGYVTVIAGESGIGKSTIACDITGKVTARGQEVLLIADEDNEDDTLVPRLNVAGADLSKVHHMQEMAWEDDESGYAFEILRDADKLRKWLTLHPQVKVIVIDPWLNYVGRKNSYNAQEVRQVLMPLQGLAREFEIAILAIAHFKKGSAEKANERIGGSAAIVQVPRSVLLVAQVKEENGVFHGELHQTKHNLNPQGKGRKYQIIGATSTLHGISVSTSKVIWNGDSHKNAEVLFAAKDPKERSLDLCCEWLTELLGEGELPASEVIRSGERKGFSQRTVFRAFNSLKGKSTKKEGNRAFWSLS